MFLRTPSARAARTAYPRPNRRPAFFLNFHNANVRKHSCSVNHHPLHASSIGVTAHEDVFMMTWTSR
jgi:hypothetical protein